MYSWTQESPLKPLQDELRMNAAVHLLQISSMIPPAKIQQIQAAIGSYSRDPFATLTERGLLMCVNNPEKLLKNIYTIMGVLREYESAPWYAGLTRHEELALTIPGAREIAARLRPALLPPVSNLAIGTPGPEPSQAKNEPKNEPKNEAKSRQRGAFKLSVVEPMAQLLVFAASDNDDPTAGLHTITKDTVASEEEGKQYVVQASQEPYYSNVEIGVYKLLSVSKKRDPDVKLKQHAQRDGPEPATVAPPTPTYKVGAVTRAVEKPIAVTVGGRRKLLGRPVLPQLMVVGRANNGKDYTAVIPDEPPTTEEGYLDIADQLLLEEPNSSFGVYLLLVSNERKTTDTVRTNYTNMIKERP